MNPYTHRMGLMEDPRSEDYCPAFNCFENYTAHSASVLEIPPSIPTLWKTSSLVPTILLEGPLAHVVGLWPCLPLVVLNEPRLPPKTAEALASVKPLLRGRERMSRLSEMGTSPRVAGKPVALTAWEGGASKLRAPLRSAAAAAAGK